MSLTMNGCRQRGMLTVKYKAWRTPVSIASIWVEQLTIARALLATQPLTNRFGPPDTKGRACKD